MATFLDIGLAQHFGAIFPVLLVFVIVFALLEKTKILGDNKGLHAIIALCLGIMMLFVPGVVQVVSVMAPWFILLLLFIVFLMILLMSFGVEWTKIVGYASKDFGTAHWFVLVVMIIVFLGAIGSVYGNSLLPYSGGDASNTSVNVDTSDTGQSTNTGDFNANVGKVIFHPKVLGLLLVLMIGALAIKMLTGPTKA